MKTNKTVLIAAIALFSIGLSSCDKKKEKIAEQEVTIDIMEKELASKDSTYNELIDMLTKAEDQVAKITERENLVVSTTDEGKRRSSDQMLSDLNQIDKLIKDSNASIKNLSAKLKKSNIEVSAFKKRITQLNEKLEDQQVTIMSLRSEIRRQEEDMKVVAAKYDSIQLQTVDQRQIIADRDQEIELLVNTTDELNKVHYVVGSYKELKETGIVDKEGGFLWIGRTIDLDASVDKSQFIEKDIRDFSELKIDGDKIKLVTEHPKGSYDIVPDELDEDVKYLRITDPAKFWEISNYLVITTKG